MGVRFGRSRTGSHRLIASFGTEIFHQQALQNAKIGLDFTPFYLKRYSTLYPHDVFVFEDFLYYTLGQFYCRINYLNYFSTANLHSHALRPEIGISPYFQIKDFENFYELYLRPSISYGFEIFRKYDLPLSQHHLTIGCSISYELYNKNHGKDNRIFRQI